MRLIALSSLATLSMLTACASSRTTSPADTRGGSSAGTDPVSTSTSTETATGELRQTLIELRRVHFAYNQSVLLPSARQALSQAADSLKRHPGVVLYIEGHADQRGDESYNLTLSRERAEAVLRYLVSQGVDRQRLELGSYGKSRLLARGTDVASLAKNRRADFRLVRGEVELVVDEGELFDDLGRPLSTGRAASR